MLFFKNILELCYLCYFLSLISLVANHVVRYLEVVHVAVISLLMNTRVSV